MKRVKIVTIRQAQNGNYLINGQSNNPIWVNGGEMRSLLIGFGLSANTQPATLIGSTITFDEKVITQDDITNGTNKVKLAVPRTIRTGERAGEEVTHITYNTAGAKQFNFGLELSDKLTEIMMKLNVEKGSLEQDQRAEDRLGRRALTNDEDIADELNLLTDPEATPETPAAVPQGQPAEELEPEL